MRVCVNFLLLLLTSRMLRDCLWQLNYLTCTHFYLKWLGLLQSWRIWNWFENVFKTLKVYLQLHSFFSKQKLSKTFLAALLQNFTQPDEYYWSYLTCYYCHLNGQISASLILSAPSLVLIYCTGHQSNPYVWGAFCLLTISTAFKYKSICLMNYDMFHHFHSQLHYLSLKPHKSNVVSFSMQNMSSFHLNIPWSLVYVVISSIYSLNQYAHYHDIDWTVHNTNDLSTS